MGFDNIKVMHKVIILVAIAAVAMLGISFSGYRSLGNADFAMESMYQHEMQGVQHLGKAVEHSRVMMVKTLQIVMLQDSKDRLAKVTKQQKEHKEGFENSIAEYKESVKGMAIEDTSEIDKQWQAYCNIMARVTELATAGNSQEALAVYEKDGSPATRGLRDAMHAKQQEVNETAEARNQRSMEANQSASFLILAVTLVSLIIQVIFSRVIAKSITDALETMTSVCEKLRDGDFATHAATLNRGDEFGHMSRVMSDMQQKLASYMKGIFGTVQNINDSASNLKEASMQSAQASMQSAQAVGDSAELVQAQETALKNSQSLLDNVFIWLFICIVSPKTLLDYHTVQNIK